MGNKITSLLTWLGVPMTPETALMHAAALHREGHFGRGLKLLERAARGGSTEAAYLIGNAYLRGEGVPADAAEAARWLGRAADLGHAASQSRLAALYLAGLRLDEAAGGQLFMAASQGAADYSTALRYAEPAAEAGDAGAQIIAATAWLLRPPPLRDIERARHWFALADASGPPAARLGLGVIGLEQASCTADIAAAMAYLQAAAEAGLAAAHYYLGQAHEREGGPACDAAQAAHHYAQAAQAGMRDAQARYGHMLLAGEGVVANEHDAETWLRRAGLAGDAGAAFSVGKLYAGGEAVPPNYTEAALWFRRAAEAGHGAAAHALGVLYLTGKGLPPDPAEAARWFLRATEAGDPAGAYNYAICCAQGLGVPRDDTLALAHLRLAAPVLPEAAHWYGVFLQEGRGGPVDTVAGQYWLKQAAAGHDDSP